METRNAPKHSWRAVAKREASVVFVYVPMFVGALTFDFLIGKPLGLGGFQIVLWALVGSALNLPAAYSRIGHSQQPYLIRIARAFREGFVPMSSILLDIGAKCRQIDFSFLQRK